MTKETLLLTIAVLGGTGKEGRGLAYRWAKAGNFPSPIKLGARAIGWRRDEVEAWLASRPATMTVNCC